MEHPLGVFLKIDVGYNRTGIAVDNFELINSLLLKMNKQKALEFKGFLAHAGHSYKCRSKEAIEAVHLESKEQLVLLKNRFKKQFPNLIISLGDTPGCSVSEDFSGVDEIRPGNFVFYDLTQNIIGSNDLNEIAIAMACPIVAKHIGRNEIVVYGGGIHFSKDRIEDPENGIIFGRIVEKRGSLGGLYPKNVPEKSLSRTWSCVGSQGNDQRLQNWGSSMDPSCSFVYGRRPYERVSYYKRRSVFHDVILPFFSYL